MLEGIRRNWRVSEQRREERNQRVTSFPKNGICFINHDNETAIHKSRGYKVGDENKEREERGGVKKNGGERKLRLERVLSTYHVLQNSCVKR